MSSTRKISRFWDELRLAISFPRFVQEFLKIVNFKMSSELFETHMLKCLINIDKEELEEKRSLLRDKGSLFSVQIPMSLCARLWRERISWRRRRTRSLPSSSKPRVPCWTTRI